MQLFRNVKSRCTIYIHNHILFYCILHSMIRFDYQFAITFTLIICGYKDRDTLPFHFLLIYSPLHTSSPPVLPSLQLYDLGSPAESSNTVPGCSLIDDQCTNMEQPPSCGKRGLCHGERGSFGCLCEPGFTGPLCDQGEHVGLIYNWLWGFFEGKYSVISVEQEIWNFRAYQANRQRGKSCVPECHRAAVGR